jgi:hypothetical protein
MANREEVRKRTAVWNGLAVSLSVRPEQATARNERGGGEGRGIDARGRRPERPRDSIRSPRARRTDADAGAPRTRTWFARCTSGAAGVVSHFEGLAYCMNNIDDCTFRDFAVGYYGQADSGRMRDDFSMTTNAQWHHDWALELGR